MGTGLWKAWLFVLYPQCSGKTPLRCFKSDVKELRFEGGSVGAIPTSSLQQRQAYKLGGCCRSGDQQEWADERHFEVSEWDEGVRQMWSLVWATGWVVSALH